jgi:sugar/nucleoside kinase (ribokinase family)
MPHAPYFIDTVFLGCLTKETIINRNQRVFVDHAGGNLLYSSFAAKLWGKNSGLLSKVSSDFPESWITQIGSQGFNTAGIKRVNQDSDLREFFFITETGELITDNPQKYFLEFDHPFPKSLLGYAKNGNKLDSKHTCGGLSIKPEDIPTEYLDCSNLVLCPLDFISHSLVPVEFRTRNNARVFLHGANGYMHSSFFTEIPALVCGAELFFTTEKYAKDLFLGKCEDIWEMLEFMASFEIATSIIHKPADGFYLYQKETRMRTFIPHYPVLMVDPVGVDDAFFGGYVASYLTHFDPVVAAAAGAVSSSIKLEGSTAFYLLDTLPALAASRLEKLLDEVQNH